MANVEAAVQFALAQIGKPYVWGTAGPNTYDCSGLIYASFRHAGVKISRVTLTQIRDGSPVSKTDLRRGDIVFPDPGHVQMYLGNGQVVHSPHSGARVRINNLARFYAARRIVGGAAPEQGTDGVETVPVGRDSGLTAAVATLTNRHTYLRALAFIVGGLLVAALLSAVVKPAVEGVVDYAS